MSTDKPKTGSPPGLLQDDNRDLSQWLASKPDAMKHADEAAKAVATEQLVASIMTLADHYVEAGRSDLSRRMLVAGIRTAFRTTATPDATRPEAEPDGFFYETKTPHGIHRDFSPTPWNGCEPPRAVAYWRATLAAPQAETVLHCPACGAFTRGHHSSVEAPPIPAQAEPSAVPDSMHTTTWRPEDKS